MSSRVETTGSSYEVSLKGELVPSLLAAFTALGACRTAISSAFLLPAPPEQGILDIVTMLHARGLLVLDVRRVTSPAVATGP